MMTRTLTYLFVAAAATLFCFAGISAQAPAANAAKQPDAPLSQVVTLDHGQKQDLTFTLREIGSITIRVSQDAETAAVNEAGSPPIAPVKISLRSMDPGFETWVIEQYTDETGSYTFELLRPGKYKIEVDASVPSKSTQAQAL